MRCGNHDENPRARLNLTTPTAMTTISRDAQDYQTQGIRSTKSRTFSIFILYIFQSSNSYNFVYFTIRVERAAVAVTGRLIPLPKPSSRI